MSLHIARDAASRRSWRRPRCAAWPPRRRRAASGLHVPGQPLHRHDLSAKEAETRGCEALEGAPVTVIQRPAARGRQRRRPRRRPRAPGRSSASTRRRSARATATRGASSRPSCGREEEQLGRLQKEYNNGEPERQGDEKNYQKYLDRVAEMKAGIERKRERHRRARARAREAAAVAEPTLARAAPARPRCRAPPARGAAEATRPSTCSRRWSRWCAPDGRCVFANAAFENVLGLSRRSVSSGTRVRLVRRARSCCATRSPRSRATSSRPAAWRPQLRAPPVEHGASALPVHVIVNQMDGSRSVAGRAGRDRAADAPGPRGARARQAQANKELIRNLAHEIKNPLGGIRGAAQLLEMEVEHARADRVHAGDHRRGRPAAGAGRPAARAAPPAARRRPTSTSTRSASGCVR